MPTDDTSATHTPDPYSPGAYADPPFPYLRWAKDWLAPDPHSLGLSGLAPLDAEVRAALGMAPCTEVGDPRRALKAALAARYGLAPQNVHPTAGTSHANFVTFFALAHGRPIVVEEPAYEALPCLARALGSQIRTVTRDGRRGWRFDPAALADAVRPGTALIAVSDLHNPSGARLHGDDLDLLVAAAESVDAWLLVDEVYLDFDPQDRPTAARRSPRVLTTASLTKAHGLPDLRAGWILGEASVIARIDAWDDLVHPALPPTPMADAARYVPQARALLERTRTRAAERAQQVDAWVHRTPGVHWSPPDGGLTGFLQLDPRRDGDGIALRLWEEHRVRIVPGSFFQRPHGLRISFLLEEADLAAALDALTRVLETTP